MTDIILNVNGTNSSFAITKVERNKLYPSKKKAVVDENNKPCEAAYLTADGSALLPSGSTALLHLDEHWDTVEKAAMYAVDKNGKALPQTPSTRGVPQPAHGPVNAQRILDFLIDKVYELTPVQVDKALEKSLKDGAVFETSFNYLKGWKPQTCFVLMNAVGFFAVAGDPTNFEFVKKDDPILVVDGDDAAEDLDLDLDFSM